MELHIRWADGLMSLLGALLLLPAEEARGRGYEGIPDLPSDPLPGGADRHS